MSSARLCLVLSGRVAIVATACNLMSSTAVALRPWAALNSARRSSECSAICSERRENSAMSDSATPVIS